MPAPHWYLEHCREQIELLREMLDPLESGFLQIGSRQPGQVEWIDVTADRIAFLKRAIRINEGVVERLEKGE